MHRKTIKIKGKPKHVASVLQITKEDKAYHNLLNYFIIDRLKVVTISLQDQHRKMLYAEVVKIKKKIKKLIMSWIQKAFIK